MGRMTLADLLDEAFRRGASDLHLSAGLPPLARCDGEVTALSPSAESLLDDEIMTMLKTITTDAQLQTFVDNYDLDFAFQHSDRARCRVNVFRQTRGVGVAFRLIPAAIPNLRQLAAPPIVRSLCESPSGLVLVTGATGSGKSTTLAAMIDEINRSRRAHILTLEDPVEFVHAPNQSLINQREIGVHTRSFAGGLRAALREDPDIILVGEMRDLETIRLALTAAETGHLVFATLHTTSAAKTINRIVDVFGGDEKATARAMLSESLRAVVSQTLVKKADGGRIAAFEVMVATPPIRNLIRKNETPQLYSAMQTGGEHGMQTMDQALRILADEGVISADDARLNGVNKNDFAHSDFF